MVEILPQHEHAELEAAASTGRIDALREQLEGLGAGEAAGALVAQASWRILQALPCMNAFEVATSNVFIDMGGSAMMEEALQGERTPESSRKELRGRGASLT